MPEKLKKELNLQKIFIDFAILLNERFSKIGKKLDSISEDTIRFLFFHACTQNGIKPNEITLEEKGTSLCRVRQARHLEKRPNWLKIRQNILLKQILSVVLAKNSPAVTMTKKSSPCESLKY